MIYTVLCRPEVDKKLAAKVSIWIRDNVATLDAYGKTHVEFFVWGNHEADE